MLILTRKPGESLFIGGSVKITIMEIKGNQIRLGIDAPKELRIYREEIYLQIIEENKMASDVSAAESLGNVPFGLSEGQREQEEGLFGSQPRSDLAKPGSARSGMGNFTVKRVSGLNSMKTKVVNKDSQGRTGTQSIQLSSKADLPKAEQLKQPEVVLRKKIKPTEEA